MATELGDTLRPAIRLTSTAILASSTSTMIALSDLCGTPDPSARCESAERLGRHSQSGSSRSDNRRGRYGDQLLSGPLFGTLYSNPATSPAAVVHDIVAMVERLWIDTVISATDLTTMLLASQPNLSRIVRLMAPERASYENLTDKARLAEFAAAVGILIPTTQIARTAAAVIAAAHQIGFPVVLKPARSRYLKGTEIVSPSVEIVENPGRLSAVLNRSKWMGDIPCTARRLRVAHMNLTRLLRVSRF